MWDGHGMGGFGFALMMLTQLLFWALLIGAAIYLVRTLGTRQGTGPQPSSAEQILAERYARGEIDEAEYQQRLQTLRRT